jgi:nucleosome-remodeling factor subunit BPTF
MDVMREEKEKLKKRERKLEEEETMQQATWVKYTFPIKHQGLSFTTPEC